MNKSLVLIVGSQAEIAFYSDDPGAALHQFDVSSGKPLPGGQQVATFDGKTATSLPSGLYAATASEHHKLVCTKLAGDGAIVVLGGEDPWPVPPPKVLASVNRMGLAESVAAWIASGAPTVRG